MSKKKKIGEVLLEKNLLSKAQIQEVLEAQESSNKLIGELLVERQMISELLLYQALAHQYQMAFIDLSEKKIDTELIKEVPIELAEQYKIIPIEKQHDNLIVALSNPRGALPVADLCVLTGAKGIRTVLCTPDQIKEAIRKYYL